MDKVLLTPEETAHTLGIGRSKVYELLRVGALESVRIGTSRRIPVAAVSDYLATLRNGGEVAAGAEEAATA